MAANIPKDIALQKQKQIYGPVRQKTKTQALGGTRVVSSNPETIVPKGVSLQFQKKLEDLRIIRKVGLTTGIN